MKMTIAACILVALVVGSATATAAKLITSGDIKNGTIKSEDIKDGYVKSADIKNGAIKNEDIKKTSITMDRFSKGTQNKINKAGTPGATGPQGPSGSQGPKGDKGDTGPAAATEFGVAAVYVDRTPANTTDDPARWAAYSVPLGSPTGSTTGGQFRFTCTAAQAPCKLTIGAAVISDQAGTAAFYPRLVIHREDQGGATPAPQNFCEYADGANNNLGVDQVPRVPTLEAAVTALKTPLTMGVGSSLDCGAGQPDPPPVGVVTEIWVPAGSNGQSAFYDVWATLAFGGLASEPDDNG